MSACLQFINNLPGSTLTGQELCKAGHGEKMSMGPASVRRNHLSGRKGRKTYPIKLLVELCRTQVRERLAERGH